MMKFLKWLYEWLCSLVTNDTQHLPQKYKEDFEKKCPGEKILFSLQSWEARFAGESILKDNTYFLSWIILTEHRIIVAKNSKSFKNLKDFPLNEIKKTQFNAETRFPEFELELYDKRTLSASFLPEAEEHFASLRTTIHDAISRALYKTCHHCTRKVKMDAHFCPGCAAPFTTLPICPHCKEKISEGDRFCAGCGGELK